MGNMRIENVYQYGFLIYQYENEGYRYKNSFYRYELPIYRSGDTLRHSKYPIRYETFIRLKEMNYFVANFNSRFLSIYSSTYLDHLGYVYRKLFYVFSCMQNRFFHWNNPWNNAKNSINSILI